MQGNRRFGLRHAHRFGNSVEWAEYLLSIGDGIKSHHDVEGTALTTDIAESHGWVEEGDDFTPIIYPTHRLCDEHNDAFLKAMPGREFCLYATNRFTDEASVLDPGMLSAFEEIEGLRQVLRLKVGSIVACVRNIDPTAGILNGTRLRVLAVNYRVIEVLRLR